MFGDSRDAQTDISLDRTCHRPVTLDGLVNRHRAAIHEDKYRVLGWTPSCLQHMLDL